MQVYYNKEALIDKLYQLMTTGYTYFTSTERSDLRRLLQELQIVGAI